MKKRSSWLLISMLVLVLALSGCRTVVQSVELSLPTLEAFRPALMPDSLIAEPQASKDLLHNSVTWEFFSYDWQDYALALEKYLRNTKIIVGVPP